MKILQIIPTLTDGGAERFVVDFSNQLVVTDEVCLCVLFPLDKDLGFFKEELSAKVTLVSLNKKLGFDPGVFFRLKKLIQKYRPDIIHTHLNSLSYLLPLTIVPGRSFKVVHTIHNDASKEIANRKVQKLRHWSYRNKKVYPVTISTESDRSFKEVYPNVASTMIYNGIRQPRKSNQFHDIERFITKSKKNSETKVFVHIGRVTTQKNHIMLVKAFQKLLESEADVLLLMIGGERNTVEGKKISEFLKASCNESIIWLGGNQPATDYLNIADFFCLSSIYEGMPISLIEAFACSCVPICTPVGGIPEMIENVGILSEDLSENAYYASLMKGYNLSDDIVQDYREKMKKLFIEQYSIEICAKEYRAFYTSLEN